MYLRLSGLVTRHWAATIVIWLIVVAGLRLLAPRWDDVTFDGDLAFLPSHLPSVRGEQLARAAFPQTRAKSQIVLVVAREDRPLEPADLRVADLLASRFHLHLGAAELKYGLGLIGRATRSSTSPALGGPALGGAPGKVDPVAAREAWERALASLDEAVRLDEEFAAAHHNRALVLERLGRSEEAAQARQGAWELAPFLRDHAREIWPPGTDLPLVDVWNRHHEVFGTKLRSADKQAQLIILQLSNEFMATDNMRVLRIVEEEVDDMRRRIADERPGALILGISGSAAVGGDMLSAAAESIRHTEWLTMLLVVLLLLLVYRSPWLIAVPLITIAVSLSVSTGLLALLTQVHLLPGFTWWGFKVFKTTKIFIVVILFGSGTDFCLFLIARLREELQSAAGIPEAVRASLFHVGDALVASALTTVLGLAMMYFAEFGKFRNSGPAIGLCLVVTLLACLTLAPALLCGLGRRVFWSAFGNRASESARTVDGWWQRRADGVIRRPLPVLFVSLLLMSPLAVWGWSVPQRVTFDFLSELPPERSSMVGSELLKRHFPVGEGGPVIVLARQPGAGFDDPEKDVAARAMGAVYDLTKRLRDVAGVVSVRSIAEPLGDRPEPISLITSAGRRKLFLRQHTLTKSIFLAQTPPYEGQIARFELVLKDDPFSRAAIETLSLIDARLHAESQRVDSFWRDAEFVFLGTTAGIRDLRAVTHTDYWRITVLVTLVVLAVIWFMLRHFGICVYLILSVLFSYLVTIGATELFFRGLYGATFVGLDWKVPIFLFVILVAVGEDYNIYLVTRVLEEQKRLGPFAGLREAMARTGAIITSCGIIMAGSFVSMVVGSLRGISELGFALTLGILLDTFVVRTLLVPAFLALIFRWTGGTRLPPARTTE